MKQLKQLVVIAAVLCVGVGAAHAQGVGIPLGSTELNSPGLSPNISALPSPMMSSPTMGSPTPGGSAGLAAGTPSAPPSFGMPLSNPRITNYGAGGMQLMPGMPRGSRR
jgi:hypothetical protein